MLSHYIRTVMTHAQYRVLPEDDSVYGELPGFDDVHAYGDTLELCRHNLAESLEEWIFFRVSRKLPLPPLPESAEPSVSTPEKPSTQLNNPAGSIAADRHDTPING